MRPCPLFLANPVFSPTLTMVFCSDHGAFFCSMWLCWLGGQSKGHPGLPGPLRRRAERASNSSLAVTSSKTSVYARGGRRCFLGGQDGPSRDRGKWGAQGAFRIAPKSIFQAVGRSTFVKKGPCNGPPAQLESLLYFTTCNRWGSGKYNQPQERTYHVCQKPCIMTGSTH